MPVTNKVAVASHMVTEIMRGSLGALWRKYVLLQHLNADNIDGTNTDTKKIPKKRAIAKAFPDVEGMDPGAGASLLFDTINATPVGYVQIIELTMAAMRKFFPGATREQIVAAIEAGGEASVPLIAHAIELSIDAHLRTAEEEACGLFGGLARSSGAANTVLGAAAIIDADTKLLAGVVAPGSNDGAPLHDDSVLILDAIGVGQLRREQVTGSGASLSSYFGNPQFDASIMTARGLPENGLRGTYMGIPLYVIDSSIQDQNSNTRKGALILRGSGPTESGQRGFAEFTEGHAPAVEFERSSRSDILSVPSRWEWVVTEHTDEHGVEILYKLTLT